MGSFLVARVSCLLSCDPSPLEVLSENDARAAQLQVLSLPSESSGSARVSFSHSNIALTSAAKNRMKTPGSTRRFQKQQADTDASGCTSVQSALSADSLPSGSWPNTSNVDDVAEAVTTDLRSAVRAVPKMDNLTETRTTVNFHDDVPDLRACDEDRSIDEPMAETATDSIDGFRVPGASDINAFIAAALQPSAGRASRHQEQSQKQTQTNNKTTTVANSRAKYVHSLPLII